MADYSVKIVETSIENMSARERILFKDTSNAVKLDEATTNAEAPLVIRPQDYAILQIHNGKSQKNPDYQNYMIVDDQGGKYITGSPSFWAAFKSIWDEMADEEKGWQIEVYKMPSKNYAGKDFITCSIL